MSNETQQPQQNKTFFGKLLLSKKGTTIFFYKENEVIGQILVDYLLDVFVGSYSFVTISLYKDNHFVRVGRIYEHRGYVDFLNIAGEKIAECLKKDVSELIKGSLEKVAVFYPMCAKKHLQKNYGYSEEKTDD